ncbi:aminoglycoside phosphotransferase family protein [Streptomyces sp. NPDC048370]|uniref:aminoglycoside phosphotransferase family protein n=1 Tax=Streptomyces sp. NPDC048370 TaxID=3365540 RepID=UPI003721B4A2
MTQSASIPSDLWQWITENLPDANADKAVDVSWDRGDSRVWRVPAGEDDTFVKLSPSAKDYEREVVGYAYAARVLAPHEAPRLLAADPGLQAIMTSSQPGRVVRDLPLDREEEQYVHERAGNLLRRWHDASAPASEQDRDIIRTSMADQADEAASCLEHAAGHLDNKQRTLVKCVSLELPQVAERLPVVYRHGDYATRNWMWHPQRGHGVIDFERAGHGIAVEEFVWLYAAVWATRPDLRSAYLAGYGRQLSESEERALRLLTARLAVSYLATGLTKRKPALVERGHLVLTRMTHE